MNMASRPQVGCRLSLWGQYLNPGVLKGLETKKSGPGKARGDFLGPAWGNPRWIERGIGFHYMRMQVLVRRPLSLATAL